MDVKKGNRKNQKSALCTKSSREFRGVILGLVSVSEVFFCCHANRAEECSSKSTQNKAPITDRVIMPVFVVHNEVDNAYKMKAKVGTP